MRLSPWISFFVLVFFSSCASAPTVQPQVNGLVVAERFDQALKVLEKHKDGYGKNNELLYLMDKGLVLHLAGRYAESIPVFEAAKIQYDQLYTKSISRMAGTWVYNDYAMPYLGEDFERVMVNVFQALNFVALGEYSEALVEARDADIVLNTINAQYSPKQKNVYREDAFARFLMGIFYEAQGDRTGVNDAFISYRKAVETYESDYLPNYKLGPPRLLIENLLAAAQVIDPQSFDAYRAKYQNVRFSSITRKQQRAEVYLIHYNGLSPLKYQDSVVFPLPGGYISKIAFPRYKKRIYERETGHFSAVAENRKVFRYPTELGQDIGGIAMKNLDNRKVRVLAKAVLRPAGKYLAERAAEKAIAAKYGDTSADVARYASDIYNVYSEQADVRAWQTLPAEIRIARLILPPGDYDLRLDGMSLGHVSLKAGDKKFVLKRTSR